MNKNNDENNIYFKTKLIPTILVLLIVFIFAFIGIEYFQSLYSEQKFSLKLTALKCLSSLISNIFIILLVSVLMEMTTLKNYTRNLLQETADVIYNNIKTEERINYTIFTETELREQLNKLLLELIRKMRISQNLDIPISANDLKGYNINLFPKILKDCANAEYYEDYDTNIRIEIMDKEWIKMTTTTSFIVHNSLNNTFDFTAMYPTIETYKSLEFIKVIVYSTDKTKKLIDLTDVVNNSIRLTEIKSKQEHHNIYKTKAEASFFNLGLKDYYLEFTRCYIKRIQNGVFVHSNPKAIKNFQAEILLFGDINNDYKLYGISFFPYKQVNEQMGMKLSEICNGPHNISIKNNNWCIPGSGISFTLMRNLDTQDDFNRYKTFKRTGKILNS